MISKNPLVAFVMLLYFACLVSSSENEVWTETNKVLKSLDIEHPENLEDLNVNQNASACDCGKNSLGCTLVDNIKKCRCIPGFATGQYGKCVESCNENRTCENGGSCLQHVCFCLPGTSGPFCKTIDDCERNRLCAKDEDTTCEYDVERQKAFCRCRIMEALFDEATATCQVCECNVWYRKDYKAWSNCEWVQGEKVCTCRKGHSYNPRDEICSDCDCGKNSKWCEFGKKGDKICGCEDGYVSYQGSCQKCVCGKHGLCNFKTSWAQKYEACICDQGYEEYKATCLKCSCGKYGKCEFNYEGKQLRCNCETGYAENDGKCEMCYCGDNVNCTFNDNRKVCECDDGYANINGFCMDIDECKHNPCGISRKCINSLGSFQCKCDEGYQLRVEGILEICEDINECESSTACTQPNTECLNTPGSFKCVCTSGFASRGDINSATFCEKTSDWAIYTVVLATTFVALFAGIGVVVYAKRYSQSTTGNTILQELR